MKKVLAFLLSALLLSSSLVSCKKETTTKDEANFSDPTLGDTTTVDEYIDYLAEKNNFSGKSFTWIGGGSQAPTEEEEMGDMMSDALYHRQMEIEDHFHIDWINFSPAETEGMSIHPVVESVKQDVLAGSGAYDAGYGTAVAVCQPLFVQSLLTDVSDYNTIDFDQTWWTQSLRTSYAIDGAIYFLNGSIVTSNYLDPYGILFSKQAQENYAIEDLYTLVKNGEWTFDKMFEIASVIPAGRGSGGAYRYASPNGFAILFGCGLSVTQYDSNGIPYVPDTLPEEISDLADKFSFFFGGNSTARGGGGQMLADGGVLFMFATMQSAAEMRQMENINFGILPIPKYDKQQEDYISYAEPWIAFHAFVPRVTKDENVTDVMLEAMAALGQKHIKPAYYDNILKSRSTYDFESQDMIDIIFETKIYDLLDILAVGGGNNGDSPLVNALKTAIVSDSSGLASKYKMQARIVNLNIGEILDDIDRNR